MKFEIVNDDLLNPDSRHMQKYRRNISSQDGEDGLIAEIFNRIGVQNSVCCDVGASDGFKHSNTWMIINKGGWHGVLIEADSDRFDLLMSRYIEKDVSSRVALIQELVDGDNVTLGGILDSVGVPLDFDFLSIDVDGVDWHIWKSLEKYTPRVVCIEFNPSFPNNVYYVQDSDTNVRQGSSLRATIELGRQKGYELVATTDFNAIFVLSKYYELFAITDNSIYAMHSPGEYEAAIFQFYDGTSCVAGRTSQIWVTP